MLLEILIAARLDSAAKSLKRLESQPEYDYIADVVFDWAERQAQKREFKRQAQEQVDYKPTARPDSSKRNRTKK